MCKMALSGQMFLVSVNLNLKVIISQILWLPPNCDIIGETLRSVLTVDSTDCLQLLHQV